MILQRVREPALAQGPHPGADAAGGELEGERHTTLGAGPAIRRSMASWRSSMSSNPSEALGHPAHNQAHDRP